MGESIENKVITIKHEIDETPKEDDFQIITKTINTNFIKPGSNQVLIKCLQISIDPYQLNRMKKWSPGHNSIMAASKLVPCQEIDSHGVGKVVASGHPQFQKDDLVKGRLSWAQYVVVEDVNLNLLVKFDPTPFPLSYHLGVLGTSGLTAYSGLFRLGQPKKGERILVSSASGSVGHLVGQYAKLFGCYVVGCAGTTEKVILLKEKLGFDEAFNYREESNLKSTLKRYFPEGIDIYFDNVGGEMLEAAVANMNTFGRVLVCGVISEYTNPTNTAAPNMLDVIYKRITIRGFLVADHRDDSNLLDFVSTTSNYLHAGKLQVLENICYGLESIPSAFVGMFHGRNIGKTIVKLADH
ncbi:NADP-dependent alkenal double bond reductase P2-like [Amaranthus tricolor]|uniref:NADP-dependent alkenal double bond reductase P2-like n=1 Tax=Amaranthus tricolor TaxID=29722 RepID=UPI00258FD280|nr:NADP-dependent alkenal double bond reductase P2-like [Amaranthus tricolor]